MIVASLFMCQPCTGWSKITAFGTKGFYSSTDEFTLEFCKRHQMKLFRKTVDEVGCAKVVHLDLQSEYALKHPESNQAHYQVEAVLVENA